MSTPASLAITASPADDVSGGPAAPEVTVPHSQSTAVPMLLPEVLPAANSEVADALALVRFSHDVVDVLSDPWKGSAEAVVELTQRVTQYGGSVDWVNLPSVQAMLELHDLGIENYKREMEMLTLGVESTVTSEEIRRMRAHYHAMCTGFLEDHRIFCERGGLEELDEHKRELAEKAVVAAQETILYTRPSPSEWSLSTI